MHTSGRAAYAAAFALFLCALSACASSVLIRPDDSTFSQSMARLERTSAQVQATPASEPERRLFMQAEAFYRYRFDDKPRSFGSYLAQSIAVAAELPALQAFSGSLDLTDLRLRTYDGAVHLWESFLLRYPQSSLRPLALYRLGWAYRCASVSGLPRSGGDQAFEELLAQPSPVYPSERLLREAMATPWKSKDTAAGWSLIPGAAHMYAGEYQSGFMRLGVALAAATAVIWPLVSAIVRRQDLSWKHDWPLLVSGTAGVIVLSIDYTVSYNDAMRAVVDFNERQERGFERTHPDAP